ncbi:MAG TPA: adenylate/guanylate cyclase domain-containing protein [Candidatus Limnocylindria bacterium]
MTTPSRATGVLGRLLASAERPGDPADLRVRKRTAVVVALALSVVSLLYIPFGIVLGQPVVVAVAVLQSAGQLGGVAYLARTGRLAPMVVWMIAVGQLVIISGVATLGGLVGAAGNLVWGLLTPMAAVLFLGRRAAVPALALYVGVVLLSLVIDAWLIRADPAFSPELVRALYAVNLLGPASVALGLVVFIDGERVAARERSESLLLNVLPRTIVERLHGGERVIADHCPNVTVLFSDVVDFTPFSEREAPERVVAVLNGLFTAFDALATERGLEKIKTIGDAYMVVAGVPDSRDDHAAVMVDMALAMHAAASVQPEVDGRRLELRTGIASGPVVAGVIGRQKFSYDLWGDTVNTASRMESSGLPGCIQVTEATWRSVADRFPWQVREGVEVKGKGPMRTYLLDPSQVAAVSAWDN